MDELVRINLILREAIDGNVRGFTSFHEKYNENLIATGERSVDYSLYSFQIGEFNLLIDFSDFSYSSFSVISDHHKDMIKAIPAILEEENS